jgi:hypothetical protein
MTPKTIGIAITLFVFACTCFAYDLILKNGKVIQGNLISESNDLFVIEDASGVKMNFKKANVDLEKTAEANKSKAPEPEAKQEQPAAAAESVEQPAKSKKPSRVFTDKDVRRLRGQIPMEGSAEEGEEGEKAAAPEVKTEDYWRQTSQDLLSSMKEAEAAYKDLTASCQKLSGATIQTHRVYDSKTGETLDMKETTTDICSQAEAAKGEYEQAKSDYEGFMEEARQEVVPPGWLATEEE